MFLHHLVTDMLNRQSTECGLGRRFPHHRIAGDGGQEGIPRPYGNRKIKGCDHPHHSERMPLFVHPVLWPFGVHGQTIQHAGLPHRKIRHIDHFLHFAVALGLDFAYLHRHQGTQRIFFCAQRVPDQPHHLPALRSGHLPPLPISPLRFLNEYVVIRPGAPVHLSQNFSRRGVHRVQ